MRSVLITAITALTCLATSRAQESTIWENPQSAYNALTGRLDVCRVEFTDTATLLTFHVQMPNVTQIGFTSDAMLQADGKEYKIKSIKNHALNAGIDVPKSGEMWLEMNFAPLPADANSLTFKMPGAFSISNIRDRQHREGIADTYWRNEKTGDWMLGIGKNNIVYDNKVWDITSQAEKNGSYTIKASDGNQEITIKTGKEKKGQRTISVGKDKVSCSRIINEYLPDYPTKDITTKLADNNYRTGDSITIAGWYKDMSEEMWGKSREFEAQYRSIFSDNETTFHAKMDSLGRFTLRMPIENTQLLYCDWGRSSIKFIAEPGETYFLMKDFAENKTLVMGENVRLQNEWLAHDIRYHSGNYQKMNGPGEIMAYLATCDSLKNDALAKIAAESKKHKTLSSRYENLKRNEILTQAGSSLMQARFKTANFRLPEEYLDYVTKNYWEKIEGPYTALGDTYTTFFRDCCQTFEEGLSTEQNLLLSALLNADKEKKINLSEADKALIKEYVTGVDAITKKIAEAPDSIKQQLATEFNNGSQVKGLNKILARDGYNEIINSEINLHEYKRLLAAIKETPGWNQLHRDMALSTKIWKDIDRQRKPLQPTILQYADANITLQAAKSAVHEIQDKYQAIYQRTLASDNIKSADQVKDISDGEQILRKITEPYKGKIVLLDIWGTWCGPCKEALSHSQEEYARLKDYPMIYLYLANNSPEDSWKNVIKEYNITGPNVAHYNLPPNQQKAVENFLNVHSFPTYKLIDQQGNLLQVNADPRDIDSLENLIKRIAERGGASQE